MSYKNVYLIGSGSFFPGESVDNETMDEYITPINGRSDKMKKMILKDNGIMHRHYGINKEGQTVYSLAQMAAKSVTASLEDAGIELDDLDMIATGTCGGDLIVPGFSNLVQAELKAKPMETSSHIGICASGVAALRHAADSIELGRISKASVSASEFPSRMFKNTRFVEGYDVDFDSHFLRYMLSDGSGSFVLSDTPHEKRPSLKLLDIHLKSYSGDYASCMLIGAPVKDHSKSMFDYPSFADAEKDGAMLLRQNIRMLPQLFEVCLHEYANLVNRGVFDPNEIDHFATHYSSMKFEGVMEDLMTKLDIMIPKDKWFSNLVNRGNMGAASIFTMLDELLKTRDVKVGEKVLCFIPESGRFSCGFILFEVCAGMLERKESFSPLDNKQINTAMLEKKSVAPVDLELSQSDQLKKLVLNLSDVWSGFRSRVWRTEYFSKITKNQLTQDDYLKWMENWIPQVREGSKWMRTAINNMEAPYEELKEIIETHASEEQDDWQILYQDYKNAGGKKEIDELTLNVGGNTLNDFMYSRANSTNALDLLGGIYIIEGTGQRIIPNMLPLVRSQLSLPANCFKFLNYHGVNDEHHIQRWVMAVEIVLAQDTTGTMADKIIETANHVADFYCKQMEEVLRA